MQATRTSRRLTKKVVDIGISYSLSRFDSRWEEKVQNELLKILHRTNPKSIWTQITIEGISGRFDVGFQFGKSNPTLVIIEYDGEQHFRGYGLEQIQAQDIRKQQAAIDLGAFFVRIDYNQKDEGINASLRNAMINLRKIRKSKDYDKSKMIYYSNPAMYDWIINRNVSKEPARWCCVQ